MVYIKQKWIKPNPQNEDEKGVYSPKERINNQIVDLWNGLVSYWEQYKITNDEKYLSSIFASSTVLYLWIKNSIESLGGETYKPLLDKLKRIHDTEDKKDLEDIKIPDLLEELSSFLFDANYISGEYKRTAIDFNKLCEQYAKEIE